MKFLPRISYENPVLLKELRVRLRGSRAFTILAGYLICLSLVLFIQYLSWWSQAHYDASGYSNSGKIGSYFFSWLSNVQTFLVVFITPAFTSGTITLEREQQTIELLQLTRLSRFNIVLGKLLSSVSFIALLLFASLPLYSICFLLGGVSPSDIIINFSYLLLLSVFIGCIGLAWSSLVRTSSSAILFTYGCLIFLSIFLIVFYGSVSRALTVSNAYNNNIFIMLLSLMNIFFSSFTYNMTTSSFLVDKIPAWLGGAIQLLVFASIFLVFASSRLRANPDQSIPMLRTLSAILFFITCIFSFICYTNFINHPYLNPGLSAIILFIPPAMLLILLPSFLCTGIIKREHARKFWKALVSGWTKQDWKQGTIFSSLPFLLSICTIGFLLLLMPITQLAHAKYPQTFLLRALVIYFTSDGILLIHFICTVFAMIIGLYSLGIMLSLLINNRWAAMGAHLCLVLSIFLYPFIAINVSYGTDRLSNPWLNLFYLDPFLIFARQPASGYSMDPSMSMLWFWPLPSWIVSTIAWLVISLILFMLMPPLIMKTAVRSKD